MGATNSLLNSKGCPSQQLAGCVTERWPCQDPGQWSPQLHSPPDTPPVANSTPHWATYFPLGLGSLLILRQIKSYVSESFTLHSFGSPFFESWGKSKEVYTIISVYPITTNLVSGQEIMNNDVGVNNTTWTFFFETLSTQITSYPQSFWGNARHKLSWCTWAANRIP